MYYLNLNFLLFVIIFLFSGCVSQSKYESIEEQNKSLISDIQQLKLEINTLNNQNNNLKIEVEQINLKNTSLSTEIQQLNIQLNEFNNYNNQNNSLVREEEEEEVKSKKNKRIYKESEVFLLIKEYYEYNRPSYVYRNLKVKKEDDDFFLFTLEECRKSSMSKRGGSEDCFSWDHQVRYIYIIDEKGKYQVYTDRARYNPVHNDW